LEGIIIREMCREDLPQVQAIENQCFTTPWNITSFKYELRNKDAILEVTVYSEQIVGYICMRTMLGVTYIFNLAVLPRFRRIGIGSALLSEALRELKGRDPVAELITLEVRESNTAAIRLYDKFGFKLSGKRTGYYQKPREDAVIMGLKL